MGLFGKKRSNTDSNQGRRLKNLIEEETNREDEDLTFLTYLYKVKDSEVEPYIRPMSLFLDVVEMIMSNPVDFKSGDRLATVYRAERIYKEIFIYDEETPNAEELQRVFVELFDEGGAIALDLYDSGLFRTFYDKSNYIYLVNAISVYPNLREVFTVLTNYGISVREYYIDDGEYLSNMIRVAKALSDAAPMQYESITSTELTKVQRMNGIYNLDAVDVARAEKQLQETRQIMDHSLDVITQVDQRTKQLQEVMEEVSNTIRDIGRREAEIMQNTAETCKQDLATEYKNEIKNQKKQISLKSEQFVKQMFEDASKELEQLRTMAKTISSSTSLKITKMNQEAENVLRRVQRMVNDDEEVRRILKQADENQEFMRKVSQIEMFNDTNLAAIEQVVSNQARITAEAAEVQAATGAQTATGAQPTVIIKQPSANAIAQEPTVVFAAPERGENVRTADDIVDYSVNPLLDPEIPFKDRLAIVMKEKNRRMKKGEHFHEVFDDVLIALMEDSNPYLIGPSGCGKTYMVRQLTELLNLDFIDIGYINEEYDILGFQTATGGYSTPNFYLCYKYGMVAFCDELDNGNSRATVKLNSFLSNVKNASYNFPNGENVKRHSNFRIIAAGNTSGNGADSNYNTREKIEESVQQRFMPIYVNYDNEVEKAILADYPDWFSFIVLFRTATTAWGESSGMGEASGILTTRDASHIKRYLDNDSFDTSQIVKYEFIQTKELDYLLFLENYMKDRIVEYPDAEAIFLNFADQVEQIREKGGRR